MLEIGWVATLHLVLCVAVGTDVAVSGLFAAGMACVDID